MPVRPMRETESYQVTCFCGKTTESPTPTFTCTCGRLIIVCWRADAGSDQPAKKGNP